MLAIYAQTYDEIKNWAQELFKLSWPIITAPTFSVIACIIVLIYTAALIYTNVSQGNEEIDHAAASRPTVQTLNNSDTPTEPTVGGRQPQMTDDRITQNHSGVGHNISAGTVNFGPQPRKFSSQEFAMVREQLQEFRRDVPWFIQVSLNDQEAINLAREIFSFMKERGFDVDDDRFRMALFLNAPKGLSVTQSEPYTITVGPVSG